jgi:glycine cleavage system regulatory protein
MPSSSSPRPRVKEAVERFVARVRHNIDVHLDTLAADLVRALEEDGGKVTTDRLNDLARAASNIQAQEGKLDMLAKLVAAMRLQDEATSIKGILESLARGSSSEAARVAVLLVDGDTLRAFTDFGYTAGSRPNDVSLDSYAALKKVATEKARLLLAAAAGVRLPDVPPFMRAMSGNSGVVVPVVVAGHVVALMYAEGSERDSDRPASSLWLEHVEVLVRHASSRLENLTSRRTVEVLTSTS